MKINQGLVHPAVAPYSGPPDIPISEISSRMSLLQSPDSDIRVNAFNGLRAVPKPVLKELWDRTRSSTAPRGMVGDLMGRAWISSSRKITGKRAIVTVVSSGYEKYLQILVESIQMYGNCPDAKIVVFCVGSSYDTVSRWPRVVAIRCVARQRVSSSIKSVIYSCARVLDVDTIVSLEADTLVLGDLNPLFNLAESGHPTNFYGCRSQGVVQRHNLREVLTHVKVPHSDLEFLTGKPNHDSPFYFNGGVLVAGRAAWQSLERSLASMYPYCEMWMEGAMHSPFTDEFLMNLALSLDPATLQAVELSPVYNAQVIDENYYNWVGEHSSSSGSWFSRAGKRVVVCHVIGPKSRLFHIAKIAGIPVS